MSLSLVLRELPRNYLQFCFLSCTKRVRNVPVRFYGESEQEIRKKDVSTRTMGPGYDPSPTEKDWYDWWESNGFFKPRNEGKLFTVLLPPPNITGTLHLGHALTVTIQDVYLRWMRMKRKSVLWIPGFDHAGIATQVAVEKYLMNVLNLTKVDLGREEFLRRIENWRSEKEEAIIKQMKQMGASVDWSRKYFTMDSASSDVVTKAFIILFNKGLIYRSDKHVNWSCFLKSSISDIEIEWKNITEPVKIHVPGYKKPVQFGYLYNIAYKVCDDGEKGEEIIVSTTRPETMLGDTAIAVHPEDTRYSHLKDKFVWHPFRMCKVPIVFDTAADPELGTGAVKVTPAHSRIDSEIAERHGLEVLKVIDESGLVREVNCFAKFQKMKRFDAKVEILNELQNLGLFRGYQAHSSVIPICSRSGDVIEYLIKSQWFLKTNDMVEKIKAAILNEDFKIKPTFCRDILIEWFNNNRDWNLSRQLWWGHQIPMYECIVDGESVWFSGLSKEEASSKASQRLKIDPSKIEITQDPDVLDTWFSSGLLPLTISGWPNIKPESGLYPLGLMETGSDIVFFWVARMLMLGLEITGQLPFRQIFLHGMVCDGLGRKMSKSLGNVVLPENVISGISLQGMREQAEKSYEQGVLTKSELRLCLDGQKKMFPSGIHKCGADALRFTLCSDSRDKDRINFNVNECRGNTFFCNKIWQAFIFLKRSMRDKSDFSADIANNNLSLFDSWILSSLARTVEIVDQSVGDLDLDIAVIEIKKFFVKHYCDIYLESCKDIIYKGDENEIKRVISIMFNCMETTLRLVCPFMPFVAEELYHCLPQMTNFVPSDSITTEQFPDREKWAQYKDDKVDKLMSKFLDILFALRSIRGCYKLLNQKVRVVLSCPVEWEALFSDELVRFWKKYATLEDISLAKGNVSDRNVITRVCDDCIVHVYHEYDREALRSIFAEILSKEDDIKQRMEELNSAISQPDYECTTPSDIKKGNLTTVENLAAELKRIEELKEVIDKAH